MVKMFFYWGLILSMVIVCMELVRRFDEKRWEWTFSEYKTLFFSSAVNGLIIWHIMEKMSISQNSAILLCLLAGCLLFACMTDCKSYEVFSFIWWIGGGASGIMLLLGCVRNVRENGVGRQTIEQQVFTLFLYILLQELFFCKFYGKADCHAFAVCGMAETALCMGMAEYLLHMIIGFTLLTIVQAFRGNINRAGNLVRPVAFLPYITISFWVLLFLEKNVILERISKTIYMGGL